jgi:hypothetical protein
MGGKPIKPQSPFGHYLFVGKQGGGKTLSAIWYAELLVKKYRKFPIRVYSNIGIGDEVSDTTLINLVQDFNVDNDEIRIIILDELQVYYPRDTRNKHILDDIDKLTGLFSQLRKRRTFILSTAQVYGRVNKSVREQALYMVNCRKSKISKRVLNEFIDGDDVLCDDLGRWSGVPRRIYTHGLPKHKYDTRKIIFRGAAVPSPKGVGGTAATTL